MPAPRRSETALIAAGWALALIVQGMASLALPQIDRTPWLDEVFVRQVVTAPDLGQGLSALAQGPDQTPPGYHLLLWSFTRFAGSSDGSLRAFSLLATWLALVACHLALRRAVEGPAALLGTALLCASPVVLRNAYEARSYALLLLLTASLQLALQRRPSTRLGGAGVALAAALLCSAHYFGIVFLALVAAGDLLGSGARGWRDLVPASAGPVALLLCLPYHLGQRAGISALLMPATAPLGLREAARFVQQILPLWPLLALVCIGLLARVLPGRTARAEPRPVAGFLALPLALGIILTVSLLAHSVPTPRYAIAGALGAAAAGALLAAPVRWPGAVAGGLLMLALGTLDLRALTAERATLAAGRERLAVALRETSGPVLFEQLATLYPIAVMSPDLAPRCFLWKPGAGARPQQVWDEQAAAKLHRLPPRIELLSAAQAARRGHFHVVAADAGFRERLAGELPRSLLRQVNGPLFEVAPLP